MFKSRTVIGVSKKHLFSIKEIHFSVGVVIGLGQEAAWGCLVSFLPALPIPLQLPL